MPKCKKDYKDPNKYKEYVKRYKTKYYENRRQNCVHHDWNYYEVKLLLETNLSDSELSKIIHHSVGAIQTKRCNLKKKFML